MGYLKIISNYDIQLQTFLSLMIFSFIKIEPQMTSE